MLAVQKFLRDSGTLEELKERYAIDAKPRADYPHLYLLKYSQIDSDFSQDIVKECRGIVLDSSCEWDVVCFSMRKFHNYGENLAAEIDWETTVVVEKIDGSLCQIFPYDGKWLMAASGSDGGGNVGDYDITFNSLFWDTFKHKLPPVDCGKCFWFELCTMMNKVVVLHPEPRLVLLGGRDIDTLQEMTVKEAHSYFPDAEVAKQFPFKSFDEIVESYASFDGLKQEGFIACDGQFNRVKLKHPNYLRAHRLKDSLGSRRALVEVVRMGECQEIVATLPEYKAILTEIQGRYDALVSELETCYDEHKDIELQKHFAFAIRGCKCPSALFAVRAKKDTSIRGHLSRLHIDSVISLLGYKTDKEQQ